MVTDAETGAKGNVAVAPAVAIAVANITTRAVLETGPDLVVAGKLEAKAAQTASALTSAKGDTTGEKAAVGIAFAGTFADHITESFTDRSLTAGGAVSFQALGSSNTNAVAHASATGAPGEDDPNAPAATDDVKKQADKELQAGDKASKAKGGKGTGAKTTPDAKDSGDKGVSVAAAVAVNLVTTVSRAHLPDGLTIVAGGVLTLRSSANTDAVAKADGSAKYTGSAGSTAVGVGVAVNLVDMFDEALIGRGPEENGTDPAGPTVTAEGVVIEALMTDVSGDTVHTMGAEAKSGASGGKIGIAGSFAGNFTDLVTSAAITSGSVVDADADNTYEATDDVSLKAASKAASTVKALPDKSGAVGEATIGIGASIALNLVDDTTHADVAAGVTLTGADDLTLDGSSTHAMVTDAETGAESDKIALAPSVAVAVANISTRAAIGGDSTPLTVAGRIDAKATQTASASTSAKGATEAKKAAVGVSFAGTFADHITESFTDRSLTAGGAISFQAIGSSDSSAVSKASSIGGPQQMADEPSPDEDVKKQSEAERTAADKASKAKGGKGTGSKTTPDTKNSGGASVSVAAAVSVNLVTTVSRAHLPDGLTIVAGGSLTLRSSANTDAVAKADGTAKDVDAENGITVGVGVAINVVDMFDEALIGRGPDENDVDAPGPHVTAEGLVLEALMTEVSGDATHTMGAEATSGASGGKIGVGGAFAGNFTDLVTSAVITLGSVVDADADNTHEDTDDVSLKAASKAASTVKALPAKDGVAGIASFGIGASLALNLVDDTVHADISAGATVDGADDLTLDASSAHAMVTDAETGAKGKVAVAPAVAVAVANISTRAAIGGGAPLTVAGKIDAKASQTASALTSAKGDTTGEKAAVGIAFAGTFADHITEAFTDRSLTAGGAISFQALGSSNTNAVTKASASGAPGQKADTPSADEDVKKTADKELTAADKASKDKGGKGTGAKKTPDTKDSSSASVSVAAAVSVNLVTTVSRAHLPDGLTIVAGGLVTLRSSANTDAVAKADGAAKNVVEPPTSTSSIAVGVGVAVNVVDMFNEALIGRGPDENDFDAVGPNVTAEGLVLEALMTEVAGDATHTIGAESASGASAGKFAVAGSFAGNFADLVTSAVITRGSVIDADADNTHEATDDVTLKAASKAVSTVKALPHKITDAGVPSSLGIGASLALNLVDDTVLAVILTDAAIIGADDVTLEASGAHAMVTDAETGAAGNVAIAPSVAVAVANITSRAAIETGPDLVVAGRVDAKASQTASALTSAKGDVAGQKAAIGVSFAGTFADHITESFTLRSLTAGGAVSFQALGSSDTSAVTQASASGAPGQKADTPSADEDVKKTADKELTAADKASKDKGGKGTGAKKTPETKDSGGTSVSVAAAVSVNLVTTVSRAHLPDGLTIVAGGLLTLRSSANTDAVAKADGAAKNLATAGNTSVAVGVGVAVNVVDMFNEALIGLGPDENDVDDDGPKVTAEGITLEALMTDVSGDTTHTMGAESASGRERRHVRGRRVVRRQLHRPHHVGGHHEGVGRRCRRRQQRRGDRRRQFEGRLEGGLDRQGAAEQAHQDRDDRPTGVTRHRRIAGAEPRRRHRPCRCLRRRHRQSCRRPHPRCVDGACDGHGVRDGREERQGRDRRLDRDRGAEHLDARGDRRRPAADRRRQGRCEGDAEGIGADVGERRLDGCQGGDRRVVRGDVRRSHHRVVQRPLADRRGRRQLPGARLVGYERGHEGERVGRARAEGRHAVGRRGRQEDGRQGADRGRQGVQGQGRQGHRREEDARDEGLERHERQRRGGRQREPRHDGVARASA